MGSVPALRERLGGNPNPQSLLRLPHVESCIAALDPRVATLDKAVERGHKLIYLYDNGIFSSEAVKPSSNRGKEACWMISTD